MVLQLTNINTTTDGDAGHKCDHCTVVVYPTGVTHYTGVTGAPYVMQRTRVT